MDWNIDDPIEITGKHALSRRFSTHSTYLDEYISGEEHMSDVSEIYHENTKLRPGFEWKLEATNNEFHDESLIQVQRNIRLDYKHAPLRKLPDSDIEDISLRRVLRQRRSTRAYSGDPVDLQELASVLKLGCGQIEREDSASSKKHRTFPSGGALYPIEIYLCVLNVSELGEGLYYYVPDQHGLRELPLETTLPDELISCFVDSVSADEIENAGVILFLTASFWRTKSKYGPRGYRLALLEAGHIIQNIQLVAASLGLISCPVAGFYDDELNDLLGVDGLNEAVIYTAFLGKQGDQK